MADYGTLRRQHHELISDLNAQLRGTIQGVCEAVDAGEMTADRALAAIRAKAAATQAEIDASWRNLRAA